MIVSRLFQGTTQQALQQIDYIYGQQGFAVVSYVYGAVIVRHRLLSDQLPHTAWHEALLSSDIVLPDGAALLTRWMVAHRCGVVTGSSHLHNLNGTDFFVALLEHYLALGGVNLVCYAVYDEKLGTQQGQLLTQAGEWLKQHYGITWTYAQDTSYLNDDMDDRDRHAMSQACDPSLPTLMMVCRGVPRQELWSAYHRSQFQQYGIIVCNQGATIDYWAGREVRAPLWIRQLRLESLRRLASDPRKNGTKFWVSFRMIGLIIQTVYQAVCKKWYQGL